MTQCAAMIISVCCNCKCDRAIVTVTQCGCGCDFECNCECDCDCNCERVRNMRGVTHATHVETVTAAVRSLQCSDVAARARAHREL
jgi:hypothetical protein